MTRIDELLMIKQFTKWWELPLWVFVGISFRKPKNHPDYVRIKKIHGEWVEPENKRAANLYLPTQAEGEK